MVRQLEFAKKIKLRVESVKMKFIYTYFYTKDTINNSLNPIGLNVISEIADFRAES